MNKVADISLQKVSTGYPAKKSENVVTSDINASLYPGEMTCLLGPNGAGKSTLLKTLTAFISPLDGEIIIKKRPLKDYQPSELAKIIGVVLTEKPDLTNMTAYELVKMGRSPYTGFWGKISADDQRIIKEAFSLVGIEALKYRKMQTLSDGERQKVMIAKTLAQQTPIIFLDEPTAFLDYPSKVDIMQLLQNLAREQEKTIFLSTHDIELALQTADKLWLLDKNLGLTIGTPEDLSLDHHLQRYFKRDGIMFDHTTGLFKISHKISAKINLTGEGPVFNMACKALARKGLGADASESSKIRIVATGEDITVNGKSVGSIQEMLDTIESLI